MSDLASVSEPAGWGFLFLKCLFAPLRARSGTGPFPNALVPFDFSRWPLFAFATCGVTAEYISNIDKVSPACDFPKTVD
jgi:hypothetical protein